MAVQNVSGECDFKPSKKARRKKSKKITFEAEIVTKESAKQLLSKSTFDDKCEKTTEQFVNTKDINRSKNVIKNTNKTIKRQRKKRKPKNEENLNYNEEQSNKQFEITDVVEGNGPPKKKKKNKQKIAETFINSENDLNNDETADLNPKEPVSKTAESIRARKRRKYADLLKGKKDQKELDLQQKSLNYLSRWKHDRTRWKFEKLRQIWLLQNIYNSAKIPDTFWDTMVEYFCNSKGKVKDTITNDAVKIIEELEVKNEEEISEEDKIKLSRSRCIVQNLY